jgi:hypothetical protein
MMIRAIERGIPLRKWLLLVGSLYLTTFPTWAQQRPLRTDDAQLLEVGRVRLELGMEFLQNQGYSLSGLEGDLTRLGVSSFQAGVGEFAEFQISGVMQDFLVVNHRTTPVIAPDFAGNSTSDFGDLVLATKLKLAAEKGSRPAIAFKFAVELPNASHTSGLGNDETEFYSSVLLAKRLGPARLLGNVGMAILGNPVGSGQSDLITYGAAFIVPVHPTVNIVGEINGRQGIEKEHVGNENQSQVRLGVQMRVAGLRWDLGGVAGLKPLDPNSGIAFGITYEFKAFHK